MFQLYNIVSETDLKDAVQKLDAYMVTKQNEIDQQKESSEATLGESAVNKAAIQ